MRIPGHATGKGTGKYRERQTKSGREGHFRQAGELFVSSLGIGTYLGNPDDKTDDRVRDAVIESVRHGVNLVDTAINYRFQRGERSVGAAVRRLIDAGQAAREELVLCTKGGFVPADRNPAEWFESEYVAGKSLGIGMDDLVGSCHCLHPAYLRDQLDRSRDNLGVDTVDVYYLHNPETQLAEAPPDVFFERMRLAFEALEQAVEEGAIACYGLATWTAFRTPPQDPDHLSLADAKALARQAAGSGEDHLRFIQLPFNLAMPEALLGTQEIEGETVPLVEAALRLGLQVVASASICQAKVLGQIPVKLAESLGPGLTDAQQALQFTRSAPGFLSALVGMKHPDHVKENLALAAIKPLDAETFLRALSP